MVTIEPKKLIIEVNHPCPKEFLEDLKVAIIETVQNQPEQPINQEEVHTATCTLLELLKNIIRSSE